jgi:hypothetical protein
MEAAIKLSLIEIVGDYAAWKGMDVLAFGSYNLLCYTLIQCLQGGSLVLVNSNWDAISNILTTVLGILGGESFTSQQYLGLFMISFGLFLLQ